MLSDVLLPMLYVGIAELGDKTQLSILLLASRTNRHLVLFLGVTLAFLIVDGVAILIGSLLGSFIPLNILTIASGLVFILFGLLILIPRKESDDARSYSANPFLSGFLLILLNECGDKTQITAGVFAMERNPVFVLIGTMAALTLLSILAIYLGKFLGARLNKKALNYIAGVLFILMGISIFVLG